MDGLNQVVEHTGADRPPGAGKNGGEVRVGHLGGFPPPALQTRTRHPLVMRPRLVVLAVGLVAAVACGSDTTPAVAPVPAPAEDVTVRVMTWNLQRGQAVGGRLASTDMAPFAALVARSGADVVGLQEVTREQAEAISGALGWVAPAYVPTKNPCPGFVPPLPASCVPFGNAILSRLPQSGSEHWLLPPSAREVSLEDRALLRSVVDVDGRQVSVYVTHLAGNATRDEREAQVGEVLARIGEDGRPSVLVGDFNAIPTDDVVTRVTAAFVDAWDEVRGDEPGPTANAVLGPTRRIDYVFVGRESGFRVRQVDVLPEALSDHLAVVATLAA